LATTRAWHTTARAVEGISVSARRLGKFNNVLARAIQDAAISVKEAPAAWGRVMQDKGRNSTGSYFNQNEFENRIPKGQRRS